MTESFDICASSYDVVFTNSAIGKLQRKVVHDFLSNTIIKDKTLNILEINCGTGHDALWLASKGHKVVASDISPKMVAIAQSKNKETPLDIVFKTLDINALSTTRFDISFDLIFSNFGGLNCLSPKELEHFFQSAHQKLSPNGCITAVIMPKHCLMESLYFLAKGRIKTAFRRYTKNAVLANVDGTAVKTWYYSPNTITKMSALHFNTTFKKGVGLFIPPSYLEPFFLNKQRVLKILNHLDVFFNKYSMFSKYADHYIIALKKK